MKTSPLFAMPGLSPWERRPYWLDLQNPGGEHDFNTPANENVLSQFLMEI